MKNENENLKKAGELLDEGCNKFNKEDFHKALKIDQDNEEAIFFADLIDDMQGDV